MKKSLNKKREKIGFIYIVLLIFVIVALVFVKADHETPINFENIEEWLKGLTENANPEEITSSAIAGDLVKDSEPNKNNKTANRPMGHSFVKTKNEYAYDPVNKVITDNNGLRYKNEINGVITINDDRYLAFGLKGKINGKEHKYTSLDFDWNWHVEQNGSDYVFWAENYNSNFIWRQYYYFHEDKPMKIKHYLKNDLGKDITNMQIYYITNVLEGDEIEYNETKYKVNSIMPLHKQGNLTNDLSSINFNAEYDFRFDDLVDDGFEINEFHLGDGNVIGKPGIDIMAIGFTKGNSVLSSGQEVWVDPTFSTSAVEGVDVTPLDEDMIVIGWCDETQNDVTFGVYYDNGSQVGSDVDADDDVGSCAASAWFDKVASVSAFNSTNFVIVWHDQRAEASEWYFNWDHSLKVYDIYGNNLTGTIDIKTNVSNGYTVSVSTFNETAFVVGWNDRNHDLTEFKIYDFDGNNLTGGVLVDDNPSSSVDYSTAVSTFNETAFVFVWSDYPTHEVDFKIYDFDGNNITGAITADSSLGTSYPSISASTFNETAFVIGWYDDGSNTANFRVYDFDGNALTDIIEADDSGGGAYTVSVTAVNETAFVIGWYDANDEDASFRVYDFGGNALTSIIDADDSAPDSLSVGVGSYDPATGINLSDDRFAMVWTHSSSDARFDIYYTDGSSSIPVAPNNPTGVVLNSTAAEQTNLTNEDLSANFLCSDNNIHDTLTFDITFYKDGIAEFDFAEESCDNPEYATLTLDSGNTSSGEKWSFSVNVTDNTGLSSNTIFSNNVTIVSPPNDPVGVVLNSTTAEQTNLSSEDLNANFLCDDPDVSDTLTFDITFYNNGIEDFSFFGESCDDPEYKTVTLTSENTSTGEKWSFSVNITDDEGYSSNTVFSNNVTIRSIPNDPSGVVFNSTDADQVNESDEDLSANFLCDDPDVSDTLTYDITFYKNGIVNLSFVSESCSDPEYVSFILHSGNTSVGEKWSFSVNVTDAAGSSTNTIFSNNVTITNYAPNNPIDVVLNSTSAGQTNQSDEDLSANFLCNDSNTFDSLTFDITFYKDGVAQFGFFSESCSNPEYVSITLDSGNTTPDDEWSFSVNLTDDNGATSSTVFSNNLTVINNAPNDPSGVVLNSTGINQMYFPDEDLSANFLCDDPDVSDTLTYDITFYKNGIVNLSFVSESCSDPEYVTLIWSSGNTSIGEQWSFSVNVTDDDGYSSSTIFSNNVTIREGGLVHLILADTSHLKIQGNSKMKIKQ